MRFELDGGPRRVDLGGGYALRAPGLRGKGNIEAARAAGTRGPELATVSFDDALSSASMDEVRSIEFEVALAPVPAAAAELRGPTGENALELEVPDLGPETGQVVLSVDETGALRWHFPLEEDQSIQPAVTRGAGGVKTFRIPRAVAQVPPDDRKSDRGLVGILGRKILKVLVYPVADAVLGPITDTFVSRWEKRNRPYAVRRFGPADRGELTPEDWSRLGQGRALLFVHGTFSTSKSAFGALPPNVHNELNKRYDGRLFAFDHPTVSVDPDANARWLLEQMIPAVSLDVDLITHSRGGLVGRCLVEQTHASSGSELMGVRRIVLVGVPNAGTALANPDHMVDLVDRTTTMLNLFPDVLVTDVLEGVLAAVKVVGHAGLVHLDGLASMCPGGPLLNRLRQPLPDSPEYFSIAADFEAAGSGLGSFLGQIVADKFIDRVFDSEQNDLVVPTAGVCDLYDGPGTPIPEERRLQFSGQQGVSHTGYFSQPQTADRLLTWLT